MPMTIDITRKVRLENTDELVLAVLQSCTITRLDHVTAAVKLVHQTSSNYADLLAKVVVDGHYTGPVLRPSSPTRLLASRNGGLSSREIHKVVRQLADYGLLTITNKREDRPGRRVYLTQEGERVAKNVLEGRHVNLRPPSPRRKTIFVACAFGRDDIDLLHKTVFVPACEAVGYEQFRVDRSEPYGTITDAILTEIHNCQFMIADLTYARPSVYFEVGVAHGLGIPLLLTCRDDHYRGKKDALKVHFDLEQFMISFWTLDGDTFTWRGGEEKKPLARLEAMKQRLANSWAPRLAAIKNAEGA